MKQVAEKEESSVRLLTLEASEDELVVFPRSGTQAVSACVDHVLQNSDDDTLERVYGAYRDELEGIRDDLAQVLSASIQAFEIPMLQFAAAD